MPKVEFVNEHRAVEVDEGRFISDIADELGIAVCREEFAGTGIGDYTVWVQGGPLSPPTFYERFIKRCKGDRRMANKARVLGDCKVWTQAGLTSRLGVPRPMQPAARASEDGSEMFDHENNAAPTTWHPRGHPKAVGQGTREARVYEPPKKKKRAPKKKAAPKPEASAAKPEAAAAKPKAETEPSAQDAAPPADGQPDEAQSAD